MPSASASSHRFRIAVDRALRVRRGAPGSNDSTSRLCDGLTRVKDAVLMARQRVFLTVIALAGMLLASAYAIAMSAPAAGIFHDDGIYVVTARALAEGQGYSIISLPESPSQTKYPILFPWLLSLVWRLAPSFPDNLLFLRMVPLASTVVWLWLSWRLLLRSGASRAAAASVVALTAASPWVVFLGTALLSETLFAALLTGSLLALTRVREKSTAIGRMCVLAGLLAGACFLTRTAGIAIVVGGLAWLLVTRRRVGAIAFGAAAAAFVIPWAAWILLNARADAESYYSASNYGSWNVVFHYAWSEKFAVVAVNAILVILAPLTVWGLAATLWLAVPAFLLAACVLRGMWLTRLHPVTWCVIVYLAIIMVWVWPPIRFLVPMLPLFSWHVSVAIRRAPIVPVVLVVTAVIATSSATLFHTVSHARTRGLMWPAVFAEDWHRLSTLLDWIRRETPSDAVLIGNLDPTYFLYTDRKAVRAFSAEPYPLFYSSHRLTSEPLGSVSDFRRRLLAVGADYCVWSPARGFAETPHFRRLLDEISRQVPGSLTIATGDPAAGYVVYRIDRVKLADAERREGVMSTADPILEFTRQASAGAATPAAELSSTGSPRDDSMK